MVSDEFKEKQKTPELVEGEDADAVQKSNSKPVSFAHSFCLHGLLSYILGLVILIATFANERFGRPIEQFGLMSIVAGMGALAIALVYLCVAAIVGGADHRPSKAKTVLVSLLPICVLAVVMTLAPPQQTGGALLRTGWDAFDYFVPVFVIALLVDSLVPRPVLRKAM